jgi:cytochrome c-type biogenesis protein CcmH/NrfG
MRCRMTRKLSRPRKNLAADPKNIERVLQLSKAQAARRQCREAVETSTEGLAFAPKNADLYLERGIGNWDCANSRKP